MFIETIMISALGVQTSRRADQRRANRRPYRRVCDGIYLIIVVVCSSDWFVVIAVWVWVGIEVRDDLDLLVLDCMLADGYMD